MTELNFNAANHKPIEFADPINEQKLDTTKKWSPYQKAIFEHVADPHAGNAIVTAVAGSGKTTTIVEALKLARGQSIFLAFNRTIAQELKERGVNARTFHSLTFGVVREKGQSQPEPSKLRQLCYENMEREDFYIYATFACKLVGLAKQLGVGCLIEDTEMVWIAICEHHDIEPDSELADFGQALAYARQLLDWSNNDHRVDFDDMLYLAVKDNIALPKFDVVFVDEAQDTNPIQRAVLRKIMRPTTRLVAVGDPAQAIYGFRGADSDAMDQLAQEFNCKALPLSITYRCPTSVVKYVQQWVSHIEAAEGAPEGEVKKIDDWSIDMFRPGDLVLCRKTGPLMRLVFKFLRAQVPVTVLGRDIGQGLKTLIKKMNAKDIDLLAERLEAYRDREVAKAMKKMDEARVESIHDKVDTILFLIGGLKEDCRTLAYLEGGIDMLFQDKAGAVQFATIHKSKGLEADRVWWLGRSECPAQWARQEWQRKQEVNLCYVAGTRAKKELYLIEE